MDEIFEPDNFRGLIPTALFDWIISDFGLNDAIEAGLVKTPRVVVRDDALPDAKTLQPRLYHIYRDASVSEDLNRAKAEPHEVLPQACAGRLYPAGGGLAGSSLELGCCRTSFAAGHADRLQPHRDGRPD